MDDMGRQWWDGWEKKAPHFGGNGMLEQHLFRNDARRCSIFFCQSFRMYRCSFPIRTSEVIHLRKKGARRVPGTSMSATAR